MNNPYTASFEEMRALLMNHYRLKTLNQFNSWKQILTSEQIKDQLDCGTGNIIEEIKKSSGKIARKTEYVEFIVALQLSDFHFPNQKKYVSFELRRNVNPALITTFDELIQAFEDDTHIDCLVQSEEETVSYQIKRYRGNNTPEAFVEWLNRVIKRYGPMSGTSLVILMQPLDNTIQQPLPLDKLYEQFVRDTLDNSTFDKIALSYNDGENMVLHELSPRHHRTLIPLDFALARIRGDL